MALDCLLCLVLFVVLAMMWTEGLWSNALTLINVVFAAIFATNFFEPLATYLDKQSPGFTYVWDFLSLWAIFALSFLVLRTITDQNSKHKVRFRLPVEITGKILFALLTGWVLVSFVTFSMHLAPLARSALFNSFEPTPMAANFFMFKPDRGWLGFMHSRSKGALSKRNPTPFDPDAEFIFKYASRRFDLQEHNKQQGGITIGKR